MLRRSVGLAVIVVASLALFIAGCEGEVRGQSPPWGHPGVVHTGIDPALREELRGVLLSMQESEEGQAVSAPLMINRFIPLADRAYDPVRRIARNPSGLIRQALRLEKATDLDEDDEDDEDEEG
ncbi:MAG: PhnD/SsuA/transferrin family substrate-binding protein [Candidatus Methylomirabilales bacterium]